MFFKKKKEEARPAESGGTIGPLPFMGRDDLYKQERTQNVPSPIQVRAVQRDEFIKCLNELKHLSFDAANFDKNQARLASLIGETVNRAYSEVVYLEEQVKKRDEIITLMNGHNLKLQKALKELLEEGPVIDQEALKGMRKS